MTRKPSQYDKLVAVTPGLRRLLHVCAGCGVVGIRPGILATQAGDYGWRESAGKNFEELHLNERELCPVCADQFATR
jgi:hypothetical protein